MLCTVSGLNPHPLYLLYLLVLWSYGLLVSTYKSIIGDSGSVCLGQFVPPSMVWWFSLSRALSYHHQAEGFGRRSYEHSPLTRARQLVHRPGKWGLISLACDQSE